MGEGDTRSVTPVLLFDGDCAFCTRSAELGQRLKLPIDISPWQFTDLDRLGVTPQQATDAVKFVDENGTVSSGHLAIAAALRTGSLPWRSLGSLLVLPGLSQLTAVVYRQVANNRYRLPGGTPACAVRPQPPEDTDG